MLKIMLLSFFLFLIILISSCDTPRDRRTAFKNSTNKYSESYSAYTGRGEGDDPSPTKTTSQTTIPADASCSFSHDGTDGYASSHSHIGKFTICQSSTDNKKIYVQLQSKITDLCLIPTYNQDSSSIYIGEPRCFSSSDSTNITTVDILVNRINFEGYKVTGLMVMKDQMLFLDSPFYQNIMSVDAYLYCMRHLDTTGDPSYCIAFTKKGEYLYHPFY